MNRQRHDRRKSAREARLHILEACLLYTMA